MLVSCEFSIRGFGENHVFFFGQNIAPLRHISSVTVKPWNRGKSRNTNIVEKKDDSRKWNIWYKNDLVFGYIKFTCTTIICATCSHRREISIQNTFYGTHELKTCVIKSKILLLLLYGNSIIFIYMWFNNLFKIYVTNWQLNERFCIS